MLTALVLLAQVAAAPAPAPAAEPVIAASSGRTRTLADVARERKLGKKGVQGGTLSVAGAPVEAVPRLARGTVPETDPNESAWRQRSAAARAEVSQARAALEQAERDLPPVVTIGRGGASHAIATEIRESALMPYRGRVQEAETKAAAIPEEARKAGASPGWIR